MNRKDFLKNIAFGTAAMSMGPFSIKASNEGLSWLEDAAYDTDRVLVIIRMAGGNDGLNTFIPLDQYDNYKKARPNLAIAANKTLAIANNSTAAFHPAMPEIQSMYADGKVKIVQSVGYPDQDYSHFRSTDIWMTGADTEQLLNTGTMGRYLKTEYPNYPVGYPNNTMPDPLCIEIGYTQSLIFQGPLTGMSFAISSPDDFYQLIDGVQTPAPGTPAGEQLDYVRLVKAQSNKYGKTIKTAYGKVKQHKPYPSNNKLADQLQIIASLIAGGLKTRIYMVTIDEFDTHKEQVDSSDTTKGEHSELLKRFSQAVKAFYDDLSFLKVENRVLTITMSEFGRRIKSNASNGTDHGAAAPLFLFGSAVKSGILGKNPTIPSKVTENDNIPMQYDFRSIYYTILKEWFCVNDQNMQEILLKNYQKLDLLKPTNCLATAVHEANQVAGEMILTTYPNPFVNRLKIDFVCAGGQVLIQIINGAGQMIASVLQTYLPPGEHSVEWSGEDLPAGLYYVRMQNGAQQQVNMVMKAR
jgi:uncharacterized protein (DUF1501 family)